ncbi:MAG TPA: TetR/AcrR family transcriptional regulator [Acidimicrobiales bacterium]|nr:TetR/AcrR family transcriptional regulator [Acidimicrobiales bacterium]
MHEDGSDKRPQRGRPRSEKADRAILDAAAALLAQRGVADMSIEEVAARSGVAKTTIYRRWSSKGSLALDAFVDRFLRLQPLPDTGSLRSDLLRALRAWRRAVLEPETARSLTGLIAAAQDDPDLAAAWRQRVVEPIRGQWRTMFERAAERGEIPGDADVEVAIDVLFGPAYHRLLNGHLPITEGFVRAVVDYVVAGLGARE